MLRASLAAWTVALIAVACGVAHGAGADSPATLAQAASDTTRPATRPVSSADTLRSSRFRPSQADSARARAQAIAAADTARRRPPAEPTGFARPRWVMARSLVIPGWGQAYNGRWIKAGVIAGLEGLFVSRAINDKRELDRLSLDIDAAHSAGNSVAESELIDQYNDRSNRFIANQWWLGGVLAYSLLDAYIDAHFRNFDVNLEDDPALPPGERRAAGLKLSWQRHF